MCSRATLRRPKVVVVVVVVAALCAVSTACGERADSQERRPGRRLAARAPSPPPAGTPAPTAGGAPHPSTALPPSAAVRSLAVGLDFACALTTAGRVLCWGANAAGQLGDGTRTGRDRAAPVAGITDAVAVAAAEDQACALRRSGALWCWGSGHPAARATEITDAVAVALASEYRCAVRRSGAVDCRTVRGGAGDAGDPGGDPPGALPGLAAVGSAQAIATSDDLLCVLHHHGRVACSEPGAPPVPVPELRDATRVATNGAWSCAVRRTGALVCWGAAPHAHLGDGRTVRSPRPVAVAGIDDAEDVIVTQDAACVLRSGTGRLWCWGAPQGPLALVADPRTPGALPRLEPVTAVASSWSAVCAAPRAGGVVCWGRLPRFAPIRTQQVEGRELHAGGEGHFCTIEGGARGEVVCWGESMLRVGPLGFGEVPASWPLAHAPGRPGRRLGRLRSNEEVTSSREDDEELVVLLEPRVIVGPAAAARPGGGPSVTGLVTGESSVCALSNGERPDCWGDLPGGAAVPGDARLLSIGASELCAVRPDDRVWCWSDGPPAPLESLGAVVELVSGESHHCARRRDGSVVCWGSNRCGELGVPSTGERRPPTVVPGVSAIALAAAGARTCAVRRDGQVACWGQPYGGAPCGGDASGSPPRDVAGVVGARSVALGSHHGCALVAAGSVVCWGTPEQRGTGEPDVSPVGSRVPGLDDAVAIASSHWKACALRRSGDVACWGAGLYADSPRPIDGL